MRKAFRIQSTLNGPPVEEIEVPRDSRCSLYPLLISLQRLHQDHLDLTHALVRDVVGDRSDKRGAPGMTGWQLMVMVVLRCHSACTFDDLEVMFNHDCLIRQFLELDYYDEDTKFSTWSLQENFKKISPSTVQAISDAFTKGVMGEMGEDGRTIRADSFVCQTNTHFPTDQSLLYDALRVILREYRRSIGPSHGWRQWEHLTRQAKKYSKDVSDLKKGKAKKGKAKTKTRKVRQAYNRLLNLSAAVMQKALDTTSTEEWEALGPERRDELEEYLDRLDIIISQTFNRVILEEKVQVSEKLYSFFEKHAVLINRGKFPLAWEVGRRVVVTEGRTGLILDCRVMDRSEVDANETLPLLARLKEKYGHLKMASLDRGYRAKGLEKAYLEYCDRVVIPHWGRKPKGTAESLEDRADRWWRSGVESLISALQRRNGLKRCPDKGLDAMRRWIAGGVLARNMVTYGRFIMNKEREEEEQRGRPPTQIAA